MMQNWLTTPRSGSTPILTLEGRAGSNLAQSCYYVADEDSEEDEEEEVLEENFMGEEEGWPVDQWKESGHDEQTAGAQDGEEGGSGEGTLPGVVDAGSRKETDRDAEILPEDGPPSPLAVADLEAASSAATAAKDAGDIKASSTMADATAVVASGGPDTVVGDLPVPPVGGVVAQPLPAATAGVVAAATTMASVSAAATAAAAAASSAVKQARAMNDQSSAAVPSRAASAETNSSGTLTLSRGRATSLSPPRSAASHGFAAMKPNHTPNPRSLRARSALRAWADSASEDPWDLPAPLEFDKLPPSSTSSTKTARPPTVVRDHRGAGVSSNRKSNSPVRDTTASHASPLPSALPGKGEAKTAAAATAAAAAAAAGSGAATAVAAQVAIPATRGAGVEGETTTPPEIVVGANHGSRSRVEEGQQVSTDAAAGASGSGAAGPAGSAVAVGRVQAPRETAAGGAAAKVVPAVIKVERERSSSAASTGVVRVVTGVSTDAAGGAMAGLGVGGDSVPQDKEEVEKQGKGKRDADVAVVGGGTGNGGSDDVRPARRGSYGKAQQQDGRERRPSMSNRPGSPNSRDMQLHRSARCVGGHVGGGGDVRACVRACLCYRSRA